MAIPLGRLSPAVSSNQPGRRPGDRLKAFGLRSPLFGLAPGGACHASRVAARAVRSYRTLSPLPHGTRGGLLSVALSLGSPPPDVIRRRVSVEPGLSSATSAAALRPAGAMGIGAPGRGVNGKARARGCSVPARRGAILARRGEIGAVDWPRHFRDGSGERDTVLSRNARPVFLKPLIQTGRMSDRLLQQTFVLDKPLIFQDAARVAKVLIDARLGRERRLPKTHPPRGLVRGCFQEWVSRENLGGLVPTT